ncbi:MAG: haloalkane dehalogenase [Actinobacteria bacterium]|nr:haloalkane dehalogenase [Actinomycetota bacterium]
MPIDAAPRYETRTVEVLGTRMAYVEAGDPDGKPVVFLHGNPTSKYLWRNVMPHVEGQGRRLLAPDLVGHGESEKLPGEGDDRYRFVEHRRYLDAWFEAVGATEDVTLVVHDWGSGLGFDWANRHRDAVRGIAYMEAICGPIEFSMWPASGQRVFEGFRQNVGESLILEKNLFVERVLPGSVTRDLTDEEMAIYRAPFAEEGEARRPTLTWPRELPFNGEPADVARIVEDYTAWLEQSDVPKLYVHAEPGFLSNVFAERCRTWPNQTEVTVEGIHFVQEDSPDEIGRAIDGWLASI